MRNQLQFQKIYNKSFTKFTFALAFIISIGSVFGQELVVNKYAVTNPTVCNQFDVTLEITGNPPESAQEVVLVIDRSGSMDDGPYPEPIDHAVDAAISFVNNLFAPANNPTGLNRVAIVSFGSSASTEIRLTDYRGQADIIDAINGIVVSGATNIQAGILEADNELQTRGTFDCQTSRSIILLSDGVPTRRNGSNSNCSTTTTPTSCQTYAINAGIDAQTHNVSGTTYNQNVFTIGLIGAISGTEEAIALNTLNGIQDSGAYSTENGADLTGIYNQILGQLVAAATQLPGQSLVTDIIQNGFSLVPGSLNPSKGSASIAGQTISWNVNSVLNETITLNYSIEATDISACGIQQVGNSVINYSDSKCQVTSQVFANPDVCMPCPEITPLIERESCTNSINYSSTLDQSGCNSQTDIFQWEFFLNGVSIGTSGSLNGTFDYTGNLPFEGEITAEITYMGTYDTGCTLPDVTAQTSIIIPDVLSSTIDIVDVLCNGDSTGEINITVTGGTPPYSYLWNTGETSQNLINVPAGNYSVTITDVSGCSITSQSAEITEPDAMSIAISSVTDADCQGQNTGEIVVTATGGVPPYSYSIDNGNTFQNNGTFSGIGQGNYTVTVLDTNNCTISTSDILVENTDSQAPVINVPSPLNINGCSENDITAANSVFTYNPTGSSDVQSTFNSVPGYTASDDNQIVSITYIDVITSANCPTIVTRTFTVTDNCFNAVDAIQLININDIEAPIVSNPANNLDETLECSNTTGLADALALEPTASDNCSATTSIILVSDITTDNPNCNNAYTRVRTWNFTDDCGNTSDVFTQTITVEDNTAPIVNNPLNDLDETLECSNTSGLADALALEPTANDDCSATTNLILVSDITTDDPNCNNAYVRVRTWNFTDDCGNTSNSFTQTITVEDNTAPIVNNPANDLDVTLECSNTSGLADALALEPTATDDCSAATNLILVSDITTDDPNCNNAYTRVRTWNFTDDCGNTSNSFTQTITVEDTTAPIVNNPANDLDVTLECSNTSGLADALALEPTATDNCSAATNLILVSDITTDDPNCNNAYVRVRTWNFTDDCGNTSDAFIQTITVQDTTAPIVNNPTNDLDVTLECSNTSGLADALALEPTATDNCLATTNLILVSDITTDNPNCNNAYVRVRTWNFTDDCGNTSDAFIQTITVQDTTAPIVNNPDNDLDVTLECSNTSGIANALALEPTATDNCSAVTNLFLVSDITTDNPNCNNAYVRVRTWNFTDDCGNTSDAFIQTITVQDTTAPIVNNPDNDLDVTLECSDATGIANALALEPTATDNCSAATNLILVSDTTNADQDCGSAYIRIRVWNFTDDCGNTSNSFTQTITVEDTTPPELTICESNVTDETLECNGSDNQAIADAWNLANIATLETCPTDNCDANATYTVNSNYNFANLDTTTACGNGGSITVIYTVTDDCGNQSLPLTVSLTLEDTTPPDLSICANITDKNVECTASDNETIADTWNADNIAILEACPGDDCDADATYTVNSNYDFNNLNTICGPCGSLPVTYTVTDDCGNISLPITVTLYFGDATGPDISNCNVTHQTIECNGTLNQDIADQWHADNVAELQACADDINVNVSSDYDFGNFDTTNACGLGGAITVNYTITDDCNNGAYLTVTLTLEDTTPPDLSVCTSVTDETLECNGADNQTMAENWDAGNISDLQACPVDDCNANTTYTVTSDYHFTNLDTSNACGAGGSLPVTYTISDDCGNSSTITVTLTLEDTTPPDLSICAEVTDETLECNGADNQTMADNWNAENIADLQACPGDDCDADATYTVTSNYNFANLDTSNACGAGGSLPVTYTITDDCDNASTITVTLTLEDTTPPDLSICAEVTDETLECNGADNQTMADNWNAGNIADLQACPGDDCDADATYTVTSDYDFANLDTSNACGAGGSLTVIYTVSDDCNNSSSTTVTLTLQDTTPPDLTVCGDITNENVECTASDNETIADAWNAANIATLETCPGDDCDVDATYVVTSNYDFNNLNTVCGPCGSLPVTYTVTDDCGNTSLPITVTLYFGDATGPDLSSCNVIDETIECNGSLNQEIANQWHADNMTELQACADDINVTIDSNYDFANFDTSSACGAGGSITVIYTATDDCNNSEQVTATLTLEDTTPPDLSICAEVTDETLECNGSDNETIANNWNDGNIADLEACPGDDCDADATYTVTSDYDFANLDTSTACGAGGSITVTYTVSDDCDNASTVTVTLTLEDTTPPDLSICAEVTDETLECNGADNETIANNWNDGNIADLEACPGDDCDADATYTVTSDYDFANLDTSTACGAGGSITVTYTVSDDCDNASTVTVTLTLEDTTPPDLSICAEVTDETLECNGADNETIANNWNDGNIADLEACPGDDCDADATYTVTSDYDFANLDTSTACGAGGSITVTYTVSDDCDNASTITVTLTLEDTTPPDLSICAEVTDETLECNGADNETIANNWNTGNIADLEACPGDDCDADATYTVTSDYDFANLDTSTACGAGGSITVTYTVSDDCDNASTITVTLTLEDTTPPDLSICAEVTDETLECNGADNETIANNWNAGNIADLEACPGDDCDADATYTVSSDYDFANLDTSTACGAGGSITVTYTVSDDCDNASTITVTLTLEDTTPPDLSICAEVTDETLECNGADNETIASNWNAGNIADLEACPGDDCNADATYTVTSNFDFANLVSSCGLGGTIPVNYIITDDCGNSSTIEVTLTLEDTSPPLVITDITDITVTCSTIPDIPTLVLEDNCSNNISIIDFTETNTFDGTNDEYEIIREWIIEDECGNADVFTQVITVAVENFISNKSDNRCIDDGMIDLFDYYDGSDMSGSWVVLSGDTTLSDDHMFDPSDKGLDDYVFSYTTSDTNCLNTTEVKIALNDNCVVLPCGSEDVVISSAVTPNGDQWNEYFEITGVEPCGFTMDIKLFNRWGALIYKSNDYQNDWNGRSHNNSIGGSDTVPNGTYYYIVTLNNSGLDPFTGYIYVGTK